MSYREIERRLAALEREADLQVQDVPPTALELEQTLDVLLVLLDAGDLAAGGVRPGVIDDPEGAAWVAAWLAPPMLAVLQPMAYGIHATEARHGCQCGRCLRYAGYQRLVATIGGGDAR
jgi:hypothetical protein